MRNKNTNKSDGFTIIEVLIVLAIAGLIMLIVFLAVPALQRNSRNTVIKSDAQALAGGFSEFSSNNDGINPASIDQTGSKIVIGASTDAQSTAKVNGSTVVNETKAKPATFAAGQLWWNTGTACDGTASPRAVAVYYYVEVAGTPSGTPQCVDGK
jgi:prepilin-type N-terminal cleavage/methylation domain-containing protein